MTLGPWGGFIRGRALVTVDGELRCPACAHLGWEGRRNRLAHARTDEAGVCLLFECADGHNWQALVGTEPSVEYVAVDALHRSTG